MTISENITCDNKMDYVKIALAIETLAYYSKHYLAPKLQSNCDISEEVQYLLTQAITKEEESLA